MRDKLLNSPYSYAFGMLAMMIPVQAFMSYYNFYYVDYYGLGIGLATLARLIYQIWDAVNDPLLGYLSDRTRTRFGRRKPWIYAAMPLFVLSFMMMFSAPEGLGQNGLFVWFLIALMLLETVSAIIWVNYGALFPELFTGDRLRARASAVQQAYQIVALLIGTAATPILYTSLGYSNMALIYSVLFIAFMWFCMAMTREREEVREQEPLKLKEAFKETLKNGPFWVFNIANSFAQTVNGLISSMIPFYAVYMLGIPEEQVTILMASVFVSVIPLVWVWYRIVDRFGPVNGWRAAFVCYGVSVIPLWFAQGLVGGVIAGVIVGFGLAGFLVTPPVLTGRIIDRDAERTGRRREGMYTAVSGFITRSSGILSALAFFVVGVIYGYESGDNPGPNPEGAFRFLICIVPFLLLAVSFFISLFFRGYSDKEVKHHDQTTHLEL